MIKEKIVKQMVYVKAAELAAVAHKCHNCNNTGNNDQVRAGVDLVCSICEDLVAFQDDDGEEDRLKQVCSLSAFGVTM